MKESDVPQDQSKSLGGLRKAIYAVDQNGNYGVVPSSGWEAEELVLNQAIEEFERLAVDARQRCISGACSVLEFHMYNQRMDSVVLAQSTGFFKWQVRRHLTSAGFAALDEKKMSTYAAALGISLAVLQTLPDD